MKRSKILNKLNKGFDEYKDSLTKDSSSTLVVVFVIYHDGSIFVFYFLTTFSIPKSKINP